MAMDADILSWAARAGLNWLAQERMFNHQTHHRGQVTTLLSQHGIDPGVRI